MRQALLGRSGDEMLRFVRFVQFVRVIADDGGQCRISKMDQGG
jgi:hypothetical protein